MTRSLCNALTACVALVACASTPVAVVEPTPTTAVPTTEEPATTTTEEPTTGAASEEDLWFEYRAMRGYYRDAYWNETRRHFGSPEALPVLERSADSVDLVAFETPSGGVVHSTVAYGWPPPGSTRPRIELVALARRADARIFAVLLSVAALAEGSDRPVRPYHVVTLTGTPEGVPSLYFLLDAGMLGFGYDTQRILVVPVTRDEYQRFVERDEAVEGDRVQVLSILGIGDRADVTSSLPSELLDRW